MNYCVRDTLGYFCDWNSTHYLTYQDCYDVCGIYLVDTLLHVSQVDLTFIALLGSLLFGLFVLWFFSSSWQG